MLIGFTWRDINPPPTDRPELTQKERKDVNGAEDEEATNPQRKGEEGDLQRELERKKKRLKKKGRIGRLVYSAAAFEVSL